MLQLEHIAFAVNDESRDKEIIRDVSLTIPDNKLVVLTGPNGGGKSTLAKLIAGIEKPTGGFVLPSCFAPSFSLSPSGRALTGMFPGIIPGRS